VSTLVARRLLQFMEHAGVPPAELLAHAQVYARRVARIYTRTSCAEVDRLIHAALDLSGDEALGLHYGERMQQSTYNPLSNLVTHAASLRDGFAAIERFAPLLSDERPCRLEERGDEAVVVYTLSARGSARAWRFGAEVTVLGFLHFMRCFCVAMQPRRVTFDYPAPSYHAEYARLFRGVEQFEQPVVSIVFDRALLDLPSLFEDGALYEALRTMIEQRLAGIVRQLPYAAQIRDFLIREGFPHRSDMASVARWLGMSARSLRRRLADEGKRYDDIVVEAHCALARQLVAEGERSIQEVAFEMGFASSSAFHRAFKRWTGHSPQAWRARSR